MWLVTDWSEAKKTAERILARTMDDDAYEVAGDFLAVLEENARLKADEQNDYKALWESDHARLEALEGENVKLESALDFAGGAARTAGKEGDVLREENERLKTDVAAETQARLGLTEERDRLRAEVEKLRGGK